MKEVARRHAATGVLPLPGHANAILTPVGPETSTQAVPRFPARLFCASRRPLQTEYAHGITARVSRATLTVPRTIGAAMPCIASDPTPLPSKMGRSAAIIATLVMVAGRRRSMPSVTASATSAVQRCAPRSVTMGRVSSLSTESRACRK
jgi:hypothetical protein